MFYLASLLSIASTVESNQTLGVIYEIDFNLLRMVETADCFQGPTIIYGKPTQTHSEFDQHD